MSTTLHEARHSHRSREAQAANRVCYGMMGVVKSAFVAIYRWRVHPEKDVQFRHAWHRLTWSIREFRGSHGARLLCDETGSYVAIALWPSRESWEATTPPLPDEDELMGLLRESIAESFPPQLLTVADDLWCALPRDGANSV